MAKQPSRISPGLRHMKDRLFEQLPAGNDLYTGSRAMAAYLSRSAAAQEAMEQLAENPNPTETEARHQTRVADAAKKQKQRVSEFWEAVNELGNDYSHDLTRRIQERAGLKEDRYAAEVRAAVRTMEPSARREVLMKALDSGDAATFAALAFAPSTTTGLEPEYTSRLTQSYYQKHAPEESAALDALTDTMGTVFSGLSAVKRAANEATDPQYIGRIQAEAEKAEGAQQAFNEAMAQ